MLRCQQIATTSGANKFSSTAEGSFANSTSSLKNKTVSISQFFEKKRVDLSIEQMKKDLMKPEDS